jgi:hypothetical protein
VVNRIPTFVTIALSTDVSSVTAACKKREKVDINYVFSYNFNIYPIFAANILLCFFN